MITASQTQTIAPVQAYMHLSDEEINYYITNYKTGVVADDIKKILKLIN